MTSERYTDGARRVVVLAQEEARLLNHNYIGTEHILLGLIHEELGLIHEYEGVAAQTLHNLEISLELVREKVENIIGPGGTTPSGHIPFTPRSKKVLELAIREALQFGHNYVGTEHILLGLVREGEGVAAQVLVKLGADLASVRSEVVQILSKNKDSADLKPIIMRGPSQDESIEMVPDPGPKPEWYLIEYIDANDKAASATINSPGGWQTGGPVIYVGGHAFATSRVVTIFQVDGPIGTNTITPAGMKPLDETTQAAEKKPYVIHEAEIPPSQMTHAQREAAIKAALDVARRDDPTYGYTVPPKREKMAYERREEEKERKRKWGKDMAKAIAQCRDALGKSRLAAGIIYVPDDGSAPTYVAPDQLGLDRMEEIFAELEEWLEKGPEYP